MADSTSEKPNMSLHLDYPLKTPNVNLGLRARFQQKKYESRYSDLLLKDVRPFDDKDGYSLIIHDPFEIPSASSFHTYTLPNRTVEYLIVPKITSFEESLAEYGADE
jgi:hypothetical protein